MTDIDHEEHLVQKYKNIMTNVKNNIILHLSQFGFALRCQYAICNRFHGNFPYEADLNTGMIKSLQMNDRVYINIHTPNIYECINHFLQIIHYMNIQLNFYIMGEPIIPEIFINALLPYSCAMFLQNNTYNNKKIHSMPIGIRDGEEVFPEHEYYSHSILVNEERQIREKQYLCFMCFKNSHNERLQCEDAIGNKDFVFNVINCEYLPQLSAHCWKVPVELNYKYTHESYYTLSPCGLGESTHRFFEAIYLDSIPIVKRTHTAFDKLYEIFPCLIIDEWSDITRELLEENKEEYMNEIKEFKEKYPNLYSTLENIDELLLQT
jgi:hypothetical protein